jgi:hypothetical protein
MFVSGSDCVPDEVQVFGIGSGVANAEWQTLGTATDHATPNELSFTVTQEMFPARTRFSSVIVVYYWYADGSLFGATTELVEFEDSNVPGDFNRNSQTDITDLIDFIDATAAGADLADINKDGAIDDDDAAEILNNIGS